MRRLYLYTAYAHACGALRAAEQPRHEPLLSLRRTGRAVGLRQHALDVLAHPVNRSPVNQLEEAERLGVLYTTKLILFRIREWRRRQHA